jgi:copper transport protein
MKPARLFAVGTGILVGVLVALSLPAGPASAHADLLRTDPASGTVVDSLPAAVTLTFSEAVQPVVAQIRVIAPDGSPAGSGRISTAAAPTVRIPLRTGGPRGTYAVSYRIVSDDGHPETGVVTFSVGTPSAVPPVPVTAGAPAVNPTMAAAMGVAHFLAVLGLVLLVGPMLFLMRLWPAGLSRRAAVLLLRGGLVVLAVGTVAELYLQAPYGTGSGTFAVTGDDIHQVLVSRYGLVHLARLGVLAAIALPLARAAVGRVGRTGRILLPVLALAGLATWPLAGHPGTSGLPVLTAVADAAHLGAVALWLGGLVTLLGFVLPRASTAELSKILPKWSRWAQAAVLVLVAGGVTEAVVQVRGFGPLVHTTYGQLILVKVAILAAVLAVAAYSRRLARRGLDADRPEAQPAVPALVSAAASATVDGAVAAGAGMSAGDPSEPASRTDSATVAGRPDAGDPGDKTADTRRAGRPSARRRLWRAVLAEAAGMVVVLAVAMALVQTAPADSAQASDNYLTGPGVVGGLMHMGMLENETCMLQVRLSPAVTGTNHVNVYAYTRAGAPLTVLDWRGTAQLSASKSQPLDMHLTKVSGNHATGQLVLPTYGTWQLRFTVSFAGAPPTTVTGTLTVRAN